LNAIYRSGAINAPIVLVGEAPGSEEERAGGAFIGSAGQLLTQLLNSAGIQRDQCYLDNVFQFRPANNNLDPFLGFTAGRVRESSTYVTHRAALLERLRETTANIIVTLGNVPTYALTGKAAITKRRGSLLTCPELDGRKVMPCVHPAAALREYLFRYHIVHDLKLAAEQSAFSELCLPQRELLLQPRLHEALGFISHCRSLPFSAYDIETRGQELSHISFAASPTSGICIPFVDGSSDYWSPDEEAQIILAISEFLEDPSVTKIGQNLAFDATFLYSKYGIVTTPLHDTMVAQGVLFPDFPKGLDFLTSIYCHGEPYYKDDGKEWFKNPFGSEEVFRRYNAMDSAVLMEIWPQQALELKRTNNWDTYLQQKSLIHPLVYAGNKGIRMNTGGMDSAAKECALRIEQMQLQLNEMCGRELNTGSSPQLQKYFYVDKRLRAHTKDGKITVDDKALKAIASKGVPEAQLILDLRHEKKMLGTYYEMKLDPDGRMRCSFNPVGTAQGRISSSKTIRGTGGNFQNLPMDMQRLMHADPGYILVNQDLGQAENRVVAYVSGEERMISAFASGIDIHKQTASLIYNVPIEEVTEELRDGGKRANHGLNYDLGASEFARYYQLPVDEATFVVESYHRVYPGVREWHGSIRYELSQNSRTLTNCFGRRRTFLDRWGPELFKVAYSFVPQSTIADLMNRFGVLHLYNRQDLFAPVQFLNTIHDSIRYQIPLSLGLPTVLDIINLVKLSLETPLSWKGREFSIPVDTELGFTFDKKTMLKWKAVKLSAPREQLLMELANYVAAAGELD
jgi:uracil-DNA glycosylase family 4